MSEFYHGVFSCLGILSIAGIVIAFIINLIEKKIDLKLDRINSEIKNITEELKGIRKNTNDL